jgi:hypothetical protein
MKLQIGASSSTTSTRTALPNTLSLALRRVRSNPPVTLTSGTTTRLGRSTCVASVIPSEPPVSVLIVEDDPANSLSKRYAMRATMSSTRAPGKRRWTGASATDIGLTKNLQVCAVSSSPPARKVENGGRLTHLASGWTTRTLTVRPAQVKLN